VNRSIDRELHRDFARLRTGRNACTVNDVFGRWPMWLDADVGFHDHSLLQVTAQTSSMAYSLELP
jgi:hypothetical protein